MFGHVVDCGAQRINLCLPRPRQSDLVVHAPLRDVQGLRWPAGLASFNLRAHGLSLPRVESWPDVMTRRLLIRL